MAKFDAFLALFPAMMPQPNYITMFLTAVIIAGGSKGAVKHMQQTLNITK
jgi:hypothetical protein